MGDSSMKNVVLAGAIAGVVGGIAGVVLGLVCVPIGFWCAMTNTSAAATIVLTIIFAVIFAVLYSKLCDSIPSKGVLKGIYFGLMIWVVNIAAGAYVALVGGEISTGSSLIIFGFFIWIVYGALLGALYKK